MAALARVRRLEAAAALRVLGDPVAAPALGVPDAPVHAGPLEVAVRLAPLAVHVPDAAQVLVDEEDVDLAAVALDEVAPGHGPPEVVVRLEEAQVQPQVDDVAPVGRRALLRHRDVAREEVEPRRPVGVGARAALAPDAVVAAGRRPGGEEGDRGREQRSVRHMWCAEEVAPRD